MQRYLSEGIKFILSYIKFFLEVLFCPCWTPLGNSPKPDKFRIVRKMYRKFNHLIMPLLSFIIKINRLTLTSHIYKSHCLIKFYFKVWS